MTVTRDVIIDLLPVYATGDASADTRVLVEDYLQRDPSLRRIVEALTAHDDGGISGEPSARLEAQAVNRTRAMIRTRSWLLGIALATTLVPFSFGDTSATGPFLLVRDQPASMLAWVVAAPLWWMHYRIGRRLRVSFL